MARNNMTFTASMRLRTSEFRKGVAQIRKSLDSLKNSFLSISAALGAGLGFTKLISNLKDTAVQLSVAKNVLENVSYETKEFGSGLEKGSVQISNYGENLAFVTQLSKDYKQDLVGLINGFSQFHAACEKTNINLEQQKDIFESLTRAAAYYHMSADRTRDMMNAIIQMASKGTVMMEELRRQLGNSLPGAFNLMAAAIGVSTSELEDMMRKGKLLSEDALPRFAAMLNTVTKNINTDSLQMSINELKNSWYELVNSSGAEKMFKGIIDWASRMVQYVTKNFNDIKNSFYGLAVSIGSFKLFQGFIRQGEEYIKTLQGQLTQAEAKVNRFRGQLAKGSKWGGVSPVSYNETSKRATLAKDFANNEAAQRGVLAYNTALAETERLRRKIYGTPMMSDAELAKLDAYNAKLTKTLAKTTKEAQKGITVAQAGVVSLGAKVNGVLNSIGSFLKANWVGIALSVALGIITKIARKARETREELQRIANIQKEYNKDVNSAIAATDQDIILLQKRLKIVEDTSRDEKDRAAALKEINKQLGLQGDKGFDTKALDKESKAYKNLREEVERWITTAKKQAQIQIYLQKYTDAKSRIAALETENETIERDRKRLQVGKGRDDYGNTVWGFRTPGDRAKYNDLGKQMERNKNEIEALKKIADSADKSVDELGESLLKILYDNKGNTPPPPKTDLDKLYEQYSEELTKLKNLQKEGAITQEEYNDKFDDLVVKFWQSAAATGKLSIDAIIAKSDKGKALSVIETWYKGLADGAADAAARVAARVVQAALDKSLEEAFEEADKEWEKYWSHYIDKVVPAENEIMMSGIPQKQGRDRTFDYKKSGGEKLEEELGLTDEAIKALEKFIEKYQDLVNDSDYIKKNVEAAKKALAGMKNAAPDLQTLTKIVEVREDLEKMNEDMNKMAYSSVKDLANSMDRVVKGMESLRKVMEDADSTGWEKFVALFNQAIQVIDTVYGVIQSLSEMQKLANTISLASVAITDLENKSLERKAALLALIATLEEKEIDAKTKEIALSFLSATASETEGAAKAKGAIAGATNSGAKLPFPYNLAAIAAGVAAVIAALSAFSGYASGGIIGGSSYSGDKQLARVNSGEMILNRGQQATLFNAIKSGNLGGGGQVEFKIRGADLVGTLKNYGRVVK